MTIMMGVTSYQRVTSRCSHWMEVRGVIRFLKNRIYPVFRAKLFRKSDLMLKKCRFALRKHENRPFFAIFAIFGNSVLSQPTVRHIPRCEESSSRCQKESLRKGGPAGEPRGRRGAAAACRPSPAGSLQPTPVVQVSL